MSPILRAESDWISYGMVCKSTERVWKSYVVGINLVQGANFNTGNFRIVRLCDDSRQIAWRTKVVE